VAVVVTGTALFSLVIANVLLGQAAIRHADLEASVRAKAVQLEQASIDVEELKAPKRIYERALQIGMVPAIDIAVVSSSRRSGPSPVRGRRP